MVRLFQRHALERAWRTIDDLSLVGAHDEWQIVGPWGVDEADSLEDALRLKPIYGHSYDDDRVHVEQRTIKLYHDDSELTTPWRVVG